VQGGSLGCGAWRGRLRRHRRRRRRQRRPAARRGRRRRPELRLAHAVELRLVHGGEPGELGHRLQRAGEPPASRCSFRLLSPGPVRPRENAKRAQRAGCAAGRPRPAAAFAPSMLTTAHLLRLHAASKALQCRGTYSRPHALQKQSQGRARAGTYPPSSVRPQPRIHLALAARRARADVQEADRRGQHRARAPGPLAGD